MAALVAPALPPALALSSRGLEAPDTIYCHEGWKFVEECIAKLKNNIEGKADFTSNDKIMFYTAVYNLAWWKKPYDDYLQQLYDAFGEKINEYLKYEVLPSLTKKEFTLEELVQNCYKYKQMARGLANGFQALEQYFIPRKELYTLGQVETIIFHELIYKKIKGNIKYALIPTIKKKQQEVEIDTFDQIKRYDSGIEVDFEYILLKVTNKYITKEPQKWKSYTDYITKAEEYLREEPNLIGDQLLQSSFKEIQYLLFTQRYPQQVLEDVLFTLLRDGKAEDLSKTYRFFESIDNLKALEVVFSKLKDRFGKLLRDKGDNLRKQAEDSTSNKKVLLWEFIGLHEIEYFNGLTTIFFEALQNSVSSTSSAQFFDTIHKNIWKDQSGMLRKEAEEIYQEVKGKVIDKLIPLISKQRKQEKIIEEGKVMMPLLRKVLVMLYNMKPDCFMGDIVNPLISSTKHDYSEKASSFISKDLCIENFMTKVDESMELEKNQCCLYSPFGNINEMMDQEVTNVLFGSYSDSLLHDYKFEDLSRMYILLCSKICGLDQNTFVERVNKNESKYNNQDAKSNKKVSTLLLYISDKQYHMPNILREKLGARLQETLPHDEDISRMVKPFPETKSHLKLFVGMFKMLITKEIIELVKPTEHSTINMEAIEDAFRLAFDDGDLATLVPEILADAVCDIILKKADTDEASCEKEARRDEAIKMMSRLLVYMSNQYARVHFANICWAKLEAGLQKSFADLSNEELSEMYELFSKFNSGQERFVGMFKTNLRKRIMEMVKQQAKDSASDKESFAREVIDLHYQYKQQAIICFQDHESFRKAIEDAFRLALATSDVEILADAVCDTILKKADMMSGLLVCISARDRFDNICREKLLRRLKESFADLHEKLKQAEDSASYKKELLVWEIIELHDKFVKRVTGCFGCHTTFRWALGKVFEDFFNKDVSGTSTARLLANFCDNILKKGLSKTLTDKETKDVLDKAVKLLPYINIYNRDLFAKFCWKHLADRLLSKQSANDYELERSFLGMLKEYGLLITLKMNTMISDIAAASDSQTKFQDFIAAGNPELNPGIDLAVTVLNKWAWPSDKTLDIKFPDEMVNCLRPYEEYYEEQSNRKNTRKLSWSYSLGHCIIEATVRTKTFKLNVKPIQAAVLLLFNKSDSLTCLEIANELNVTFDDIKPSLQYLSCGGSEILKLNKKGDTGTISSYDEFTFNPDFEGKKTDKKRKTEDISYTDMSHPIHATIVRVMKKHRAISHTELVSECLKRLNKKGLQPDISAIDKGIKSLIDRECIERDNDQNTYRYVQDKKEVTKKRTGSLIDREYIKRAKDDENT